MNLFKFIDHINWISGNETANDSISLFYFLDSARNPEIFQHIKKHKCEKNILYSEENARELIDVAPYLINCNTNPLLAEWLLQEKGNSYGYFFESSASIEQLINHFKKFIFACDEKGRHYFFRFYDPRVIRIYLPTCSKDELMNFFGLVSRFIVEKESSENIDLFYMNNGQLIIKEICF